jgi:hypothetical protein
MSSLTRGDIVLNIVILNKFMLSVSPSASVCHTWGGGGGGGRGFTCTVLRLIKYHFTDYAK